MTKLSRDNFVIYDKVVPWTGSLSYMRVNPFCSFMPNFNLIGVGLYTGAPAARKYADIPRILSNYKKDCDGLMHVQSDHGRESKPLVLYIPTPRRDKKLQIWPNFQLGFYYSLRPCSSGAWDELNLARYASLQILPESVHLLVLRGEKSQIWPIL